MRKGSRDDAMVQRCEEIFVTILKIDMISEDPRILSGYLLPRTRTRRAARGLVFVGVNEFMKFRIELDQIFV